MRISSSSRLRLTSSRSFDSFILIYMFVIGIPNILFDGWIVPSTSQSVSPSFGIVPVASAWEWTDLIAGGKNDGDDDTGKYLTEAEISDLRVRDLKWRLTRSHGYSAEEVGRMIDKKELMAALSVEESKLRKKHQNQQRRKTFWRGLYVAVLCVVAVVGWPLWVQVSEIAAVNWQVYWDRKKHEFSQCIEFRSVKGTIGVLLLSGLDAIRFWLSATVLMSWILPSESPYRKYMFPIPSLPIRPGQFMGEKIANGPMGRYGMNIAPMAITWSIGFVRSKLEYWTGKALSKSAKLRRKEARSSETEEERKARKAARKAAKKAAREEKERQQKEAWNEETERRKEMAQKASEQLFGAGNNTHERNPSSRNVSEEQNDTIKSDEYNKARRQFEADMDEFDDMNDLD